MDQAQANEPNLCNVIAPYNTYASLPKGTCFQPQNLVWYQGHIISLSYPSSMAGSIPCLAAPALNPISEKLDPNHLLGVATIFLSMISSFQGTSMVCWSCGSDCLCYTRYIQPTCYINLESVHRYLNLHPEFLCYI